MKKITLKSIKQVSIRNSNAIRYKKLANIEDNLYNKFDYARLPLKVKFEKKRYELSLGKFFYKIASNF